MRRCSIRRPDADLDELHGEGSPALSTDEDFTLPLLPLDGVCTLPLRGVSVHVDGVQTSGKCMPQPDLSAEFIPVA